MAGHVPATRIKMTTPDDEATDRTQERLLPAVPRRTVLAASMIGLVGMVKEDKRSSEVEANPEAALLTQDDLVAPADEEYITWETSEAPLLSAYRRTVPGFGTTPTAGRSFRSTPGEKAPTVVETGAISIEDMAPRPLVGATDRWIQRRMPTGSTVETTHKGTIVEWRTTVDDTVDVVRLHRAGGYLLITVASGSPDAKVTPTAAINRYTRTVRRKARRA